MERRAMVVVMVVLLVGAAGAAEEPSTIIGIDLGMTHSRVGVCKNGHVEIIPNDQGNRATPSWVAFTDSDQLIGEAAKNYAIMNPERSVFNVMRLIGRRFEDEEMQEDIQLLPYKIVNRDGKPHIQVQVQEGEVKVFKPEEIIAMMMFKMKETAEAYLGKKVEGAVVTVPMRSNKEEWQAILDAGMIGGLKVEKILYEPAAVVFAYKLDEQDEEKNVLVFDLGGGTFDVTILTITIYQGIYENDVMNKGQLADVAIKRDTHLGGEDFDQRVMEYFIKLVKEKYDRDISQDMRAVGKLRQECERAKRALSSEQEVRMEIKSLVDGVDLSETLTRTRFEELNDDLFQKLMDTVNEVMAETGLRKADIDEIVLVGGSTHIPKVQQLLRDYFDGKGLLDSVSPDEVVAYGAAELGEALSSYRHKSQMRNMLWIKKDYSDVVDILSRCKSYKNIVDCLRDQRVERCRRHRTLKEWLAASMMWEKDN